MAVTVASYLKSISLLILTPQCYNEFFVSYNFFHVPCLKAALSKGLGYGIVFGSFTVKVPQITKILRSGSGEGIVIWGVILDLAAITASAAYGFVLNYPFSAWGDGLFLAIQTATVAFLVMAYGDKPSLAYFFAAAYVAIVTVLIGGMTPVSVLTFLQGMVIPVVIVGKTLQIVANYRNGSTGQLSAVTVAMLLAGTLARIFTSLQEVNDALLAFNYVVAFLLNAVTAGQVIYYWNVPAGKPTKSKSKAKSKRS